MELLYDPSVWASFFALAALEIVLGIDNIVFISVITQGLPEAQARRARQIGLGLALAMRVALLFAITWIVGLKEPLFSVAGFSFSWRDLLLIAGGLFLIVKATQEIHAEIGSELEAEHNAVKAGFMAVIGQIVLIDAIFSLDSIITAVGMADHIEVMIAAVVVAIALMYFAAEPLSHFIERNPTTKMLALTFLMLIGTALVADGFNFHVPRQYIYFSMAFAALVEIFNIMAVRRRKASPSAIAQARAGRAAAGTAPPGSGDSAKPSYRNRPRQR